jgi:hypothetical protein
MVQAHVRNLVTTTEVRLAALSAELTRSTEEVLTSRAFAE